MIKISKKNNAIIVEGVDDNLYPFSGELSYPQNSVIVVTDESDIVTFRSAANNDVLFSGLIGQLTIEGENVTKENVGEKFDKIANGTSGETLIDARLYNMHNYGDERIQLDKVHADGSTYSDYVHFKTINGETLLEEGNIEIKGDEIKAGEGIFISEDSEGAKVISTSWVPPVTSDKYVAYRNVDGSVGVDYFEDGIIPDSKYLNNTSLQEVVIGEGITQIGNTISNSTSTTTKGAFSGCKNITNVTIGRNVGKLGMSSFNSCEGLTSITLPNKLTYISSGAFGRCKNLTSIEIPSQVNTIGQYVFDYCSGLTSVTIPNSVTYIGERAFSYCKNITSVTIPKSLNSFGRYIFESFPTQGTLYCDEVWYKGLTSTQITSLGNVYNWTRNPKPTEDRLDDLEKDVADLQETVEEISLYKYPNLTLFGSPTINNGQISDFSADDYAQFPFLVNLNKRFTIDLCFTTGDNVTDQQNIIDSRFGLAMAVRNSKLVVAMSSDGQTWDMGEHISNADIAPNTTYYIKFSWDGERYGLMIGTNPNEYVSDFSYDNTSSLYPTTIVVGKGSDNTHIFEGSINLNNCTLSVMDEVIWQGMDDAGLATRLATDLSNIDEKGIEKVNEIVALKTINGESIKGSGDIVVGGDVYQVSCEFDWGNNLSVGVYKNGVITDEVTCQLEVLLADNSAEYPTPTMSGKHYVFPIIDTYLIGTLKVNLTNPYKEIAAIVVPMYQSLQRIDTALANKQDVIDDLDQMRMDISTAFSEASSAASAASDASGMASEALYGLANKQDVINETVDMEVTYDDGTTETITLYKAN